MTGRTPVEGALAWVIKAKEQGHKRTVLGRLCKVLIHSDEDFFQVPPAAFHFTVQHAFAMAITEQNRYHARDIPHGKSKPRFVTPGTLKKS